MKKNKIVPIFLSGCLLFSLCACGKKQTKAYELFNQASQKTDALTAVHVLTEENYSMTAVSPAESEDHSESQVLASVSSTDMTAKRNAGKLEAFTAKASMTLWGFTMASQVYYKDGQLYTSSMDGNLKLSNPTDADMDAYQRVLTYLPCSKDMFYRAEITENENSTEIATVFAGNEFKRQMVDFLPSHYFDMVRGEEEISGENPDYFNQLNFSDVTAKYTIRNGYLTEFQTSFILDITIDGNVTSISYRYSLQFMNPGSEEELIYPENLDEYKELS